MAAYEIGRYTNKRKIEELLTEEELRDPDLVASWGIDEEERDRHDFGGPGEHPSSGTDDSQHDRDRKDRGGSSEASKRLKVHGED